jgi:hypothetical protein
VFAVLLAFSDVLRNGFVNFDDPYYITGNPVIRQGLSPATVAWAFTTGFAANWHPLTWLSVMLDVELFGLEPSGHHAMNLGLHALNTALVFAVMRRLGVARGPAAFAAGLFGLHPLHVESVAWAAERKDVLSMAFGLLTLLAYIRYAEAPSWQRLALVTGLLMLGLMAKPMLVTLPFVLLLLDWWPLRRVGSPAWIASPRVAPGGTLGAEGREARPGMRTKSARSARRRGQGDERRLSDRARSEHAGPLPGHARSLGRLLLEKIPLFVIMLLSCVATYLAQRGAVLERMSVLSRLENAAHSYVMYLAKFAFPKQLAFYYPMMDLGTGRVAMSIVTLAVLTLAAWHMRTARPYLLVGWLWFLGTLVPMLGLVQVGGQAYADRYMYLPSLGLGLAVSLGLADAVDRAHLPRPAVVLAGMAVLAALGVATWQQTAVWRDSVTLYEEAVKATGHNWYVRLLLAREYKSQNEPARADAMLQEALAEGISSGHCAWTSQRRVHCAGGDFGSFPGSAESR